MKTKLNINVLKIENGNKSLVHFHGYSGCKEENKALMEICKQHNITYYGMDFPGQGSVLINPEDKPTLNYYADLAVELIKSEGLKDVIISGHSMGGAIACLVANKLTSKIVSHIILEDPVNFGLLLEPNEAKILNDKCCNISEHLVYVNNELIHQPIDMDLIKWHQQLSKDFTGVQLLKQLEDITKNIDIDMDIIWGKDDPVIPYAMSVKAFRSVHKKNKISLHSVDNAQHWPHSRNIPAYTAIINKILAK